MIGPAGGPLPEPGDVEPDGHPVVAYMVIAGLLTLLLAIVSIAVTALGGGDGEQTRNDEKRAAQLRKLPSYWKVKRGDTYVGIAEKTGLTVAELETFNPEVDPATIQPGQRVKLHLNVPAPTPKPKRLGPKYYTLKPGDSYGSVAADTGKNIMRLQQLNPKLKPKALQPGDRIRLR